MTDHRPLRALLVEDDPVSRAWLQAALERVPVDVDAAADCAAARDLADRNAYDLLVVDANLPDGRGDDWLRARRALGDAT
ncbi:response regulator, partial [Lysobacter xanthus]